MWLLLGYLLGRGRRSRSPGEIAYRRRKGHPWLFMLALGTAAAAFSDGGVGVGLLMVAVAVLLVVA